MSDRRAQSLRVRALLSVLAALTLTVVFSGPSSAIASRPAALVQAADANDLYFQAVVGIIGDEHLQGTQRERLLIWNRVEGGIAEPVVPDQIVHQWMRNHEAIPGANSDSYVLTGSDVGKVVSLQVRGHDPELGWTTAESNTTGSISELITGTEISGPSLSGLPFAGQLVTIIDPERAEAGVQHRYEWRSRPCGAWFLPPVPSFAATKSMMLDADDIGMCFSVRVESTKDGYVPKANTVAFGPIQDRILITGSPRVNHALTADTGSTNNYQIERIYQWLRDDQTIAGATQRTFRVPNGFTGAQMSVRIESFWPGNNTPVGTTTKANSAVVDDRVIKVTAKPGKRKATLRVDVTFNDKKLTQGTISVKEGKKTLKSNVKVTKGVATIKLTKLRKGKHTFSVDFTPLTTDNLAAYMSKTTTVRVK